MHELEVRKMLRDVAVTAPDYDEEDDADYVEDEDEEPKKKSKK